MCPVLLPLGVNPIASNKYININIVFVLTWLDFQETFLRTDWIGAGRFRDRIPGVGGDFSHPSKPALGFLYNGYRVFPGGRVTSAWL